MSIVSRVELEAGLVTKSVTDRSRRTERLEALLASIPAVDFGRREAAAYRVMLQSVGCSRRKLLDRMIAAQALVQGATLVTLNGDDFRDVPGLELLEL